MLIHTVAPGETLTSIATDYNLTVSYLERINELPNEEALVVGQDIVIAYTDTIHTVSEGDTLTALSERYGVPLLLLLRNNPTIASRTPAADGSIALFPGENIIIRFSDQTASVRNPISVIGYAYPNIDREILRRTLPFLTYLSIFTYGFTFEGELITVDDSELITIARSYGTAPILLFSTLGPDGQFNNNLSSALFASSELQERIINALIQTMQEKGYYCLDIDFEFAKAVDISGMDILQVVRECVNPKVVEIPLISSVAQDKREVNVKISLTLKTVLSNFLRGVTEETISARAVEVVVTKISNTERASYLVAKPELLDRAIFEAQIDDGSKYELISADVIHIDLGNDRGLATEKEQIEKNRMISANQLEHRRLMAVAVEQEMKAKAEEKKLQVIEAEAEIPKAIVQAIKEGKMKDVVDYYKMQNLQADTEMRRQLIGKSGQNKNDFE